jgi:hypothetical protein
MDFMDVCSKLLPSPPPHTFEVVKEVEEAIVRVLVGTLSA